MQGRMLKTSHRLRSAWFRFVTAVRRAAGLPSALPSALPAVLPAILPTTLPAILVIFATVVPGGRVLGAGIPFVEHPVATVPGARWIDVGDLDADGDVDVISAASGTSEILWHESDGGAPPGFTTRTVSAAAGDVRSVIAADLDGDLDLDVLALSANDGAITWYENDGATPPAFIPHTIAAGAFAADLASAADLDGDGDLDVMSAASTLATIAWYENDGNVPPVFTGHEVPTIQGGPFRVTAADVDADLDMDLLCVSGGDGTIAWYESDGGAPPVFTAHLVSAAAAGAASIDGADLDGDGDLDLVAASRGDDTIAWFESDGQSPPGFVERLVSLDADGVESVRAADLDGDGDFDLLAAEAVGDAVRWYENRGGSPPVFVAHAISTLLDGAVAAVAVDIDADADADVLAATFDGGALTLFENAPGPVFNETRCTYHGSIAAAIAAALDGDVIATSREQFLAEPDIDFEGKRVTLRSAGSIVQPEFGRYTLADDAHLETRPDRGITLNGALVVPPGADAHLATRFLAVPGGTVLDVGAGGGLFLDTDELSSISAVTGIAANATLSVTAGLTLGGAPAGFAEHLISNAAVSPFGVHVVDLDADGDTDVLSASFGDSAVAWYENEQGSPPVFTRRIVASGVVGARSVYAADVDGDGDMDPIAAAQLVNRIAWYENQGGAPPIFVEHVVSSTAVTAVDVFAADLDGDDDVDLLSASFANARIAWYENIGGTPPAFNTRTVSNGAIGAFSVFAADVDRDGDMDVLSASQVDNKIAWYENDGGKPPFFTERPITTNALLAYAVAAADLDGDGDTDVISGSQADQKIAWYENDGARPPSWTPRTIALNAPAPTSVHAADMDGDGDVDVLVTLEGSDSVVLYENNGDVPPLFFAAVLTDEADGAQSVTAGDLDGDGDTDVIAASSGDNTIAWFSNLGGSVGIDPGGAIVAGGAVTNRLPLVLHGGQISAGGGMHNALDGAVQGFGTIAGDFTNDGRVVVQADTEIVGDYHNAGSTVIRNGTLVILGALNNEGELIGDFVAGITSDDTAGEASRGSDGLFVEADFRSGADADLCLTGGAPVLRIAGAYDVSMTDAGRYGMAGAELRLVGRSEQRVEVMSVDIGPDPAGLDPGQPGHFPLRRLRLAPGATTVRLVDARDNDGLGQAACEAIYADEVVVGAGALLVTGSCRVYYRELTLDGIVDDRTHLVRIIACPGDVDEDGEVGFADVLEMLLAWGDCPPDTDCLADVTRDGRVDFADVLELLANWGPCVG